MNDMSQVIIPKSDQLNAEDFFGGPQSYTIEAVEIRAGTEQPVNIRLAGETRVWRPCKSMSRVLVAAWGTDANAYIGRSVTLYNDPKVKWGGMEVGGIRVSHLSNIEREMLLQLTATKGKRAPHIVKPLPAKFIRSPHEAASMAENDTTQDRGATMTDAYIQSLRDAIDNQELASLRSQGAKFVAKIKAQRPELYTKIIEADPASAQPAQAGPEVPGDAAVTSNHAGEQADPAQPEREDA